MEINSIAQSSLRLVSFLKKIVKSKNFFWQPKNIFKKFPKDIFLVERLISQCILSLISKKKKKLFHVVTTKKNFIIYLM